MSKLGILGLAQSLMVWVRSTCTKRNGLAQGGSAQGGSTQGGFATAGSARGGSAPAGSVPCSNAMALLSSTQQSCSAAEVGSSKRKRGSDLSSGSQTASKSKVCFLS